MKTKSIFIVLSFFIYLALCACDGKSSVPANAVDGNNEAVEYVYTENDTSAWCSALFEGPSTEYNNALALVAAEMSDKAEDTTGEGITQLFKTYGINFYETKRYGDSEEENGLWPLEQLGGGAYALGHSTLNINGEDNTILVIVARGSTTFGEYVGDLFKGETKDFLGHNVHRNVHEFEELVWDGIINYVNNHPAIKEAPHLKILVTGHSLGGAAANMIGARLTAGIDSEWWGDKASKTDIYIYTFGAISVLTSERNVSDGYENIHNIYNHYDSFGPNGNMSSYNASSINAKFGHTDEYLHYHPEESVNSGENRWSTYNHNMPSYIEDLKANLIINRPCEDCGTNSCLKTEQLSGLEMEPFPSEPVDQVDYFSIEGTWKNAGINTFGQAQRGAIIVFDGSHCNYFSPYDTYVFYFDNEQWTLDCSSYIFSQTLRFNVEIIDENTINIYYGPDAVHLERISRDAETVEEPQEAGDDFVIEGSWLSVGSDGFGQAQPGMTVTFDGTHCNFFSPYDTYAFYQEGDEWRLDCTSFLFSETLTFKVEIIDGDSINVYYGSNCTELRRTG